MNLPTYDGVQIEVSETPERIEVSVRTWKRERTFLVVAKEGENIQAKVIRLIHIEAAFMRYVDGRPNAFCEQHRPIDPALDRSRPSCITPSGNESDCVRILSGDTTHTHPFKW